MNDYILAASRVGRAVCNIRIDSVGGGTPMPVVVLSEPEGIEACEVAAQVGAAIGCAAIHLDANDLTPKDLGTYGHERAEFMSRLYRRSNPALVIVDITTRSKLATDADLPEILGIISKIVESGWSDGRGSALLVVTDDDALDVARSIGDALGRHDWPSFIPL